MVVQGKHGCCSTLLLVMVMTMILTSSGSNAIGRSDLSRKLLVSRSIVDKDGDEFDKYAVIFDGGSSGTRVHVFRFDSNLNLLPIGEDFEFYNKTVPGLSAYEDNPKGAADSLRPLLNQAVAFVPLDVRPQTPVRLGATAGLRLLSGDAAERIMEAVAEFLKNESGLKYKAEWVSIIDGLQEGSYIWVTINYLLETLGNPYSSTAGVVDLGGGSVQMTYAVSEETAANAPKPIGDDQESPYLAQWNLKGTTYYLYAHSYLSFGLDAFRAELLKLSKNLGNPCVINGYQGTYEYSGEVYNVRAPPSGTNLKSCRALTRKAMNLKAFCPYDNCTFNGVWNGGGGDGQNTLYVATNFYYTAAAANIVEQSMTTSTKVVPEAYLKAAKIACKTDHIDNIKSVFPYVRDDLKQFLCMDLVYEYTLLVDGFGLNPRKEINVVLNMEYKGKQLDSAWPLGCAVDILSEPISRLARYKSSSK